MTKGCLKIFETSVIVIMTRFEVNGSIFLTYLIKTGRGFKTHESEFLL